MLFESIQILFQAKPPLCRMCIGTSQHEETIGRSCQQHCSAVQFDELHHTPSVWFKIQFRERYTSSPDWFMDGRLSYFDDIFILFMNMKSCSRLGSKHQQKLLCRPFSSCISWQKLKSLNFLFMTWNLSCWLWTWSQQSLM